MCMHVVFREGTSGHNLLSVISTTGLVYNVQCTNCMYKCLERGSYRVNVHVHIIHTTGEKHNNELHVCSQGPIHDKDHP